MVADRSGKEPDHGVRDRKRPDFSSRQHKATERNLFRGKVVGHALVDILVMAAKQREVRLNGVPHRVLVGEDLSACGKEHDGTPGGQAIDRLEEGFGLHYHSRTPSVGRVVHRLVPIRRKRSKVHHLVPDEARLGRTPRDARRQRRFEELGKDRDDVDRYRITVRHVTPPGVPEAGRERSGCPPRSPTGSSPRYTGS